MRTILWNVRGLGNLARRRQIREYITNEGVDCVGLQETKKADFTDSELREICISNTFCWKWLPAEGLSRGIIMGYNSEKT